MARKIAIANCSADEGSGEDIAAHDKTILLVEDDDAVRDSAKEMLESLGYRLLVAQNASEAIQISRGTKGRFSWCSRMW